MFALFKAASMLALFLVVATSTISKDTRYDDMEPVCVCVECQDTPAVKDEKAARLLGEVYIRLLFGEKVLADYKPFTVQRRVRSRGGPIWSVVGLNSKMPADWIDGVSVVLDEKHGCLLSAGYEG